MGTLLVTGASGFVGSHLVRELESMGHVVYKLQRKITDDDAHTIQGDLTKPLQFSVNFDCVFHLASLTPLERDNKKLYKTNVEGTRLLMDAISGHTKNMVYISGLGIYGKPGRVIDESTPYAPNTKFARMRLEAQQYLEQQCADNKIGFTAVTLGDVYGPGGWFQNLLVQRIRSGTMMLPGGGRYRKAFVSVHDVAGGLAAIYESGLARPAYVIASPEQVTFREFCDYVADALGSRRPRGAPAFMAKLALGSELIKLLCTDTVISNEAISEIYQFKHPDFRPGVDWSISQMRKRNLL